jgi:uracil-DNA glycosylase
VIARHDVPELAQLRQEAMAAGVQVFGEGNPRARIMIVGEAPGREEVAAGRPFVGPAGQVLNRMLERLGIPRQEIWITNTVKTRPVVAPGLGRENRPPRAGEIAEHRAILEREIQIIRPRVIVCLGGIAASALIHRDFKMRQERGQWFPGPEGARVVATYHPSYLLRLRGPDYEAARDEWAADLSKAWAEAKA